MRKKERQLITIGLVVLFAAIAWWAYNGHASPGVLLNLDNQSNSTETYQLAVSDLSASVDQATGHVIVSFKLSNEEHFNISSVQVLYALNVADPNNATFSVLNAAAENGTYSAEIPASFGDTVYYKVKVVYDNGKELVTDVHTITVVDTTEPTLSSVSIDYNNATATFSIDFNATDNDAIATYYVYYADLGTNSTIGNTTAFTPVNATVTPITLTNITEGNYYAFYFKVEDLSGNVAMLYNETAPYIVQANSSATWPVVVPEQSSS